MSIEVMKQVLAVMDTVEPSVEASAPRYYAARKALRAAIEEAQPNDRTRHKMMIAMMRANWQKIRSEWKDDPELCHAMGYEAGYKDAVARRVEPRASGSGAGFESLPASPTWWDDPVPQMRREWQGLTDEERDQFKQWAHPDIIEAIELRLQERNT